MMNKLQEQADRIASLESELKTMTSAADDRIREDTSVLGRTCGYCNFTGDMMSYAHHVCPRDVMQSEIDSLRAQLAAATERERAAQYQCGECGEVHETWLYAMECCADQDEAAAQPASDGQEGK